MPRQDRSWRHARVAGRGIRSERRARTEQRGARRWEGRLTAARRHIAAPWRRHVQSAGRRSRGTGDVCIRIKMQIWNIAPSKRSNVTLRGPARPVMSRSSGVANQPGPVSVAPEGEATECRRHGDRHGLSAFTELNLPTDTPHQSFAQLADILADRAGNIRMPIFCRYVWDSCRQFSRLPTLTAICFSMRRSTSRRSRGRNSLETNLEPRSSNGLQAVIKSGRCCSQDIFRHCKSSTMLRGL
jgi:hypothetical protein